MTVIDYFDGVDDAPKPAATLERLTALAKEATELTSSIDEMTVVLADEQDKLTKILRRHIPEIMEELGMSEFKMVDGSVIAVTNQINASISEDNKPAAFAWLVDNHFDGIIKTKVQSDFGKGEIEEANKAVKALADAGFIAEVSRTVHPATLKSFVKERLEKGDQIPLATFGVFEFKQAKIKPAAKRK